MSGFSEVIPGVLHWSAKHPRIGQRVHSCYLPDIRVAIDPISAGGLVADVQRRGGVERVLLTNRHHLRAGRELRAEFGCTIHCPASGMHEFGDDTDGIEPYDWGEELAPGVIAHEIGAICPDDGALHVRIGPGALALADSVIRWEGELAFVPEFLMDDPERVRAGTLEALERLLDLDFDAILLAHGEPTPTGGKDELRHFVASPREASFGT